MLTNYVGISGYAGFSRSGTQFHGHNIVYRERLSATNEYKRDKFTVYKRAGHLFRQRELTLPVREDRKIKVRVGRGRRTNRVSSQHYDRQMVKEGRTRAN